MTSYTWTVFTMEIRKLISYRTDFWINFIGQTVLSLCLYYFLWKSIFEFKQTDSMGGYTLIQMILYYLMAPLTLRIVQGEGIGNLSREIYDGSLNKYLVYPVSFFKYKLATYMSYSVFYIFQLCIILGLFYLFTGSSSGIEFKLGNLSFFIIAVLINSTIYFFLSSLTELIAFWAEYIWSLSVIIRFMVGFLGGAMIPLTFFPTWAQELLYYTPFPYLITFPVNILMGKEFLVSDFFKQLIIALFWSFFFYLLANILWRKGNKSYSGVGI